MIGLVRSANNNNLLLAPSFNAADATISEPFTYSESVKIYLVDADAPAEELVITPADFIDIIGHEQQAGSASKVMVYTADGKLKSIVIFAPPVTE